MKGNAKPVAIAIAIVIAGALPLVMVGALGASITRDTAISNAQLGTVFALYSGVSMVVARPGGSLVERWGWRRAARIACLLSMSCSAGIAWLAHGVWSLAACMAVGGLGQAVAAPTSNLLLAREVDREGGGGTAMGLKQSAVPTAAIIAGACVPVFALTVGWRWAFAATALALLTVPFFVRNAPERFPGPPARGTLDEGGQAASAEGSQQPALAGLRPTLVAMAFAGFLGTSTAHAYNAFFVVSSVDRGVSEAVAATLFSVSAVACLVVRVLSGIASDRRPALGRRPLTAAGVMLGVGVIGMALLASAVPAVIVAASLIAYAAGWGWPALYHLAIVRYFADAPAKATGSLRIGLSGGAMAGPLLYGLVSSATSYAVGWLLVALVGAGGAVALIRSERKVRAALREANA